MSYNDKIKALTKLVPTTIIDFDSERTPARTPTQATSNFITNVQQGNWAEELIFNAINESSKNFVAVRYGKSDDLIAGDEGFKTFFKEFQKELDTIGKRPDLLIFNTSDFDTNLGYDISKFSHDSITDYVKKAVAGLEVRSSAFLIEQYENFMKDRIHRNTNNAIKIRDQIVNDYSDLLNHPKRIHYLEYLISLEDLFQSSIPRVPSWRSNDRLIELCTLFKKLKKCVKENQKRDFLSVTVKNEDIQVVYKWIEIFKVPHYYIQVFFDRVYGISYENILNIISDSDKEDVEFYTEKNTGNQDKSTIHIKSKSGLLLANKVDEPEHSSMRKEMSRGGLLFYVTFKGGQAYLNIDNLKELLMINNTEF
jgi:type II restriction enzyme